MASKGNKDLLVSAKDLKQFVVETAKEWKIDGFKQQMTNAIGMRNNGVCDVHFVYINDLDNGTEKTTIHPWIRTYLTDTPNKEIIIYMFSNRLLYPKTKADKRHKIKFIISVLNNHFSMEGVKI